MAVVNTLSAIVTNANASPPTMNDPQLALDARVHEQIGLVEVAAADDDLSTYRMGRVHSSWRITDMEVKSDAITGMSDVDIGLYDIASVNSGAAVDANCFADAYDMSSAKVIWTQVLTQALNIDQSLKKVWEIAGLSADPNKWYDVVINSTTNGSGAGTIVMRIRSVTGQ